VGTTRGHERRTVRLPHFLCEALGAYLAGRPHCPEDLVFTMPQGGPLREAKFLERYVKLAATVLASPPPSGTGARR
jgi:hypothetical protein